MFTLDWTLVAATCYSTIIESNNIICVSHEYFTNYWSLLIDEIMQQDIRPLLALDIIEQLHRQFAVISGKL